MSGTLYLCATPIGNLDDFSFRALKTLEAADLIAAESTEETKKLLHHYNLRKPLISYYDKGQSESKENQLLDKLKTGASVALVSSAGTPLISDPGYRLVKRCVDEGIAVIPVPGAAACITALMASGLPPHPFLFTGFLPPKKTERSKYLNTLRTLPFTLIFYESPHRIHESLQDCLEVFGNRQAVLARELTKVYEEFIRGTLEKIILRIADKPVKGELTLLVHGDESAHEISETQLEEEILALLQKGVNASTASRELAQKYGLSKNKIYNLAHRLSP